MPPLQSHAGSGLGLGPDLAQEAVLTWTCFRTCTWTWKPDLDRKLDRKSETGTGSHSTSGMCRSQPATQCQAASLLYFMLSYHYAAL